MTFPLNILALFFVQQPDNVVVESTLFRLDNVVNPLCNLFTSARKMIFSIFFSGIAIYSEVDQKQNGKNLFWRMSHRVKIRGDEEGLMREVKGMR
jgi:hypothetical protein